MSVPIVSIALQYERDVVLARQRARQVAAIVGFDAQDQTRIATAVSEVARNAFAYAHGGRVEISLEGVTPPQLLVVRVADEGPGIADLPAILAGNYRSSTGMGLGLVGAQRLMDRFEAHSAPGAPTTIVLKKLLPPARPGAPTFSPVNVAAQLSRVPPLDPSEEVQRQNQELLRALSELERRQTELRSLNRELEDTNRGVVALFAELDEKAEHLRRADELKSRFLSNMSHEFRTPVHSIQALTRMLLDRTDGPLNPEQERQVGFIRQAADSLAELVADLLDLARVEAGKTVVRPTEFDLPHLFGALRGMLRPLLVNESVALVFDDPVDVPALYTDEAKVSQILRNFISNALKFTESGEIRVSARLVAPGSVEISVADTGIGIAPEDQERIFQEFTQIDHPLQRKVQGTGLGLPLCRKLAEVLGGRVSVESEPGVGSTFSAVLPLVYDDALIALPDWTLDPTRMPLLVVEDRPEQALVYDRLLADTRYQPLVARSVREAHAALAAFAPRAVLLDILLRGEDAWGLLAELKRRADTKDLPIAVISDVKDESKAFALGADAYCMKPVDRNALLRTLTQLLEPETVRRVLLVDDEEISRYVLRQHLSSPRFVISEESTGLGALRTARARVPDAICLDLGLEDVDGLEVLRRLRADSVTRRIPVLVVTAQIVEGARRAQLEELGAVLISKAGLTREATLAALERTLGGAE